MSWDCECSNIPAYCEDLLVVVNEETFHGYAVNGVFTTHDTSNTFKFSEIEWYFIIPPIPEECSNCAGHGGTYSGPSDPLALTDDPQAWEDCPKCNGKGYVQ